MTKPQYEQDYETARGGLESVFGEAYSALSRLHAEAAKVPGLEAQSEADRYAIHGALSWSGHWKVGYDQKPSRHVAALLERLAKAESERDAMQQEVDAWKDASGLERGGSPEHVGPDHLRADLSKRDEETTALRERVAMMGAQVEELKGELAEVKSEARDLNEMHDAAEARVKELTEKLASARDAALEEAASEVRKLLDTPAVGLSKRMALTEAESNIRVLASQPPPAPAHGAKCKQCKGSGTDVDTDEEGGSRNERHFPCSRCKGLGTEPTQPALVVPDEVRTALAGYLYEAQDLHGPVRELLAPGGRGRLTLATLRQVADILGVKPGVAR